MPTDTLTTSIIPLFDSLAHPTLTGNWLGKDKYVGKANFEVLVRQMAAAGYKRACAIGMADLEHYTHEAFLAACQPFPQLVPIAGFNPKMVFNQDYDAALLSLQQMGFKGIKIHPRFSGLDLEDSNLAVVLQAAAKYNLVVFWCTYMHCGVHGYPNKDPFFSLVNLLRQAPNAKAILVHGGDVQVMRYAELVRFNPNLLLDLSLTILKYQGSSVDLDIRFLFQQFDRRICIGTDFPEYTCQDLRERFTFFSKDISIKKQENIAFRNLETFLGLT